jgi:hypothetical protein
MRIGFRMISSRPENGFVARILVPASLFRHTGHAFFIRPNSPAGVQNGAADQTYLDGDGMEW